MMSARSRDYQWKIGRLAMISLSALVLLFLIVPIFVVAPISFSSSALLQFPPKQFSLRWYETYFASSAWIDATITSVKVGVIVTVVAVLLGLLSAVGLTRGRLRALAFIRALLLAPLIVPVIVTAVALYYVFSLFRLNGTLTALIIGHTLLAFPYATVVITASLEKIDIRLEQAAIGLGANPFRAFCRVTLPLIRSGITVAALFAFLMSFDEAVMAIFITGPTTTTLPKKMWDGIRFDLDPTIAAVSTILIAFSWLLILAAELIRRRFGNSGDVKTPA
jgi:putative spermidine/putrescine transport system permease protein